MQVLMLPSIYIFRYSNSMTLYTFKLLSAGLIFAAAFFVGLFALRFIKQHSCRIHIYEAIASGIFLGAALFHMLPDSQHSFDLLGVNQYPYTFWLATITFIALFAIERISLYFSQHDSRHIMTSYLVTIVLSIHSLIAGAALGISTTTGAVTVIFIAIMAHKSCASFALIMKLRQVQLPSKRIIILLLLFSLMTPLGIITASSVSQALSHDVGQLSEAILNAITAGTFLYIGTLDTIGRQLKPQRLLNRFWEFIALTAGIVAMGVIAVWV